MSRPLAIAGGLVCIAQSSGDLRITAMSKNLRPFAGHARLVSELLPDSFRDAHIRLVRDVLMRNGDPVSAFHPLSVRLVGKDSRLHDATIRVTRLVRQNYFLVIIVLSGDEACADVEERQDEIFSAHFGGSRELSREYIRNISPLQTLTYHSLTIFFLDIKDFTNFVVSQDGGVVAERLQKFHSVVSKLVRVHKLWCMETRGDCYILISGSAKVTSDFPSSQATRMLQFAKDLELHHREIGLGIRIGIATGPAKVFFIYGSSSSAPILCTTGPTMVRAARLETAGFPHYGHVCEKTVEKLEDERFDFKDRPPSMKLGSFKGLKPESSALFNCKSGEFE